MAGQAPRRQAAPAASLAPAHAAGGAMPWFVAQRAVGGSDAAPGRHEHRVFGEAEIESIGPEWDGASSALDSRDEAQAPADAQFWDEMDD